MVCWNLVKGPKHHRYNFKDLDYTKGNQLLGGDVHVILDKTEATDMLQIVEKLNLEMGRLTSSIL